MQISRSQITSNAYQYYENLHITYPDGTTATIPGTVQLSKSIGTSEIEGMTQKAITDVLNTKANISVLNDYATKTYVTTAINNIPIPSGGNSGTANINLGSENQGLIVVVGADGNPIAGILSEEDIIEALMHSGGYTAKHAIGLEVNYNTKTFTRTQGAANLSMGSDFNSYSMYGGRKRCNVADNGTINAFYGDPSYTEDGSNGQVMVYQPKFYYQRIPISVSNNNIGKIINQDSFVISSTAQTGFKVHPLFINEDGEEVDYVLLSAYEGGLYDTSASNYIAVTPTDVDFSNDLLSSVSGTKPISGLSGLTLANAEQMAQNRGAGWHIQNIVAESANQLLEIIEFGSLNGQASLGQGVCDITSSGNYNQAALTGSTSNLGNNSGRASSTILENNGTQITSTDEGKVSISYRGVENPWGNIWRLIGGTIIRGDGASQGGTPFICTNFNYTPDTVSSNYEDIGFNLPSNSGWVNAMGYGNNEYDWVYLPIEIGNNASSALPVGDSLYTVSNLSENKVIVYGGPHNHSDSNGAFYYGADRNVTDSARVNYGARLMFIPTKNSTYTANITKWTNKVGA